MPYNTVIEEVKEKPVVNEPEYCDTLNAYMNNVDLLSLMDKESNFFCQNLEYYYNA
jgi:hypothetical protein